MNTWYNNTFDDTVASNPDASKRDIDWTVQNRFNSRPQYSTLYISSSLLSNPNFKMLMGYAFSKGLMHGMAYSSKGEVDAMLAYNAGKTWGNQRLFYATSELEPYNTGDYAGMTDKIKYAYPKLKAAGMKHQIYMGWPDDAYWSTIVEYCDEINLHCYRKSADMTVSGIWGYVRNRLGLIAAAAKAQNKPMVLNIIYSNEPDFAFDWFKTKSWYAAHQLFLQGWAANATETMKNWLRVQDMSVFVSRYGKQIRPLVTA